MSKAEEELSFQLKACGHEFRREVTFHSKRLWRLDFAWPDLKFAVEVEGITHYGKNKDGSMKLGRHQTAKGFENDLEKYGEAQKLGWTIYRCSPKLIKSGEALKTIETLLELSS